MGNGDSGDGVFAGGEEGVEELEEVCAHL